MKKLIGFATILVALLLSNSVFAQEKVYKIGDTGPAGGLIFFDKGAFTNGWRYLEAAPVDEVNSSVFGHVSDVIGTTKTEIGEGKANTKAIIERGYTESAAKLCDDLEVTYNGKVFSDYFLPSKDELNLMYDNLHKNGVGGFAIGAYNDYVSSSEHDVYNACAWRQNFYDGNQDGGTSKDVRRRVRCIRFL